MRFGTYGARICYAADGEGAGGGTTTAGGTQAPAAMTAADAAKLQQSIDKLSGGIENMLSTANARMAAEQARQAQEAQGGGDDEEEEDVDEVTLESMPRKQFTDFLLGQFAKNLDIHLKPIKDQIAQTANTSQMTQIEVQAREFANKHEDFADWQAELIAIAGEHPNLPISRMYSLARAENPEKAAKIDKELKAKRDATGEAGAARPRPRPALPPGGGGGEGKAAKMNPQQAADAAWEAAVAEFGNPFG